jgi:hypothetical protein
MPTWGGNDTEPDPCVIVYHPPSVGWMARWRELAIQAPTLDSKEFTERSGDDGFSQRVSEWTTQVHAFRSELISDLVVAVENLTMNGKAIDLSEAVAFIMDNEGLREEVFRAIVADGTIAEPEGKD